jgi:hypothetical protein
MAQTKPDWLVSFSLSAEDRPECKEQSVLCSALPCLRPRVGAPVALQQCRILPTGALSVAHLFTSPCQRGHLYFAEQGTFLLCIDRWVRSV